MSDLIERLRTYLFLKMSHPQFANIADDCAAAADELEQRNKRITELEQTLLSGKGSDEYRNLGRMLAIAAATKYKAEPEQERKEREADWDAYKIAKDNANQRIEQLEAALREISDGNFPCDKPSGVHMQTIARDALLAGDSAPDHHRTRDEVFDRFDANVKADRERKS